MRRIIIHAGFHKTGTTHVQHTLRANRGALRPDIELLFKPGMKALCKSARAYSRSREDYDLGMVKYEAAMLMQQLEAVGPTTIVLSSEDLSGLMPGQHRLHGYGAAPHLMRALAVAFKTAMPEATLTFFFTTRAADPWLRSCYAQHLRSSRMVWDQADYLKRLRSSADHDAVLDQIKREISDHALIDACLEDYESKPLGIAEALLDLLNLPPAQRAKLTPSKRPVAELSKEVNAELLALNRSDLDMPSLRKAKQALIEAAA